jgi:hypothetical protein
MSQHVRVRLGAELRLLACPLDHSGEASGANGALRSDVKTNADFGSCSRRSRRNNLNSSPMIETSG